MDIGFISILKNEMESFLELVRLSIVDHRAYQRTLSALDSFLYNEGLTEKKFDAEQIGRWLDGFKIKPITKQSKLSHVRRFAGYLSTLGIKVNLPELPRMSSDFTPYVFGLDEMTRIFEAADDLILTNPNSRIAAEFPVLLRILYGCGLRVGEANSLTWDDVDLDDGVITVKEAKNDKQRVVPMSEELLRILKLYRVASCFEMQDHGHLFKMGNGRPRTKGSYWYVFSRILYDLGIKNPQTAKYGNRGPCIHSLRHTFTMHSFLKAEAEGRTFMETVPFLSTYLGHAGLLETDKYLKARHELYTEAHTTITDYTRDIFPGDV